MVQLLDPHFFGLPTRTIIEETDQNTLALVINRQSRIIMADGKKILAKAEKIKKKLPGKKIILKTSAPVCSKTRQFLADNGISMTLI
jgi:hypothetical protein